MDVNEPEPVEEESTEMVDAGDGVQDPRLRPSQRYSSTI